MSNTVFACGRKENDSQKPLKLTIPIKNYQYETKAAEAFRFNNKMVYVPKSLIKDWEKTEESVSFWIPKWIVTDKNLEVFVDTSYMPSLFDEGVK